MHLRRALLALALLLAPALAAAQEFPSRPIKLVVPFPPGGPNDIIARTVGQKMSELLGQPVLIDNRGGAGGVLGTDAVAKAEPDGYTIGLTSAGALAISSSLQEKIPYDPLKDFKPITLVAKVPEILAVAPNVKAGTVAELVALAKAKPGDISFASSGPGSMPHLAGELFKISADVNIVHIPYRGAAPAVTDILASQVHMVFLDIPVLLPHIQSGKLKAVAVGSRERAPSLKDVPTMAEAGFPQVEAENWYGMVAPAATPPAVVAKLHKAAVAAMKSPDVKEKLAAQGAILVGDTPEEFSAYIASEIAKWRKVVDAAGVKPGN
ncbi:tripartite tricarboxylate transporter substrate binding protein [Rhodoplanes roseus]|uniref:LacI family transcriptional regulator n=1 Tax=Rhodoplanes roseus TaxID=29409 RepID=A0A327L0F6_9BRAD|nr:tripartite tricarboxylate transporter substrate binding protein [Rhodoplanes roseus]RAI43941.1 LacI family transcriptional regulator [Rhodoplanes roseus]